MSLSAYELLQHIKDEAVYLIEHSKGVSFDDFLNDPTLIRAYSRSLEIIGEATKKIPSDFRNRYPDIEWRGMAGLRDKLIHDYFGIDYDLVWDVIQNKIPKLKLQLEVLFEDFK
ncbi:MAG: hypothetical protein ACJAZV_001136 [Roseivirga sp.]|jgi:uncharacterized protein with HEPN domain